MADYTFYTNPMSRGQIARWALHEVAADYAQEIVDWQNKSDRFLTINPMGKVPTLVHNTARGDRVVTEAAAICHYLAEMHPEANLLPSDDEMADYFRWLFFAAGPVEQAVTARMLRFEPSAEQRGMAGFGSFDLAMGTLEKHLDRQDFVCGARFTMADVYVGSAVDWGLTFGSVPPNEAFVGYAERCQARPAYMAAKSIDNKLIEETRK